MTAPTVKSRALRNRLRDRLRGARVDRGYNQREVAALAGINQTTLSHFENGAQDLDIDTLARLCEIYGTPLAKMIGETPPAPTDPDFESLKARVGAAQYRAASWVGDVCGRGGAADASAKAVTSANRELRRSFERRRTAVNKAGFELG